MFDIGCVTCRYRINEGSKTALSGDLQYIIIIAVQCNCVNASNAWSETKFYCIKRDANVDAN